MFSCVCVQIMMCHARCKLTTSNARVTGANSRVTLLEPQKDPSVLEDRERSTPIPVSPKTWVHDVFFMEDIYIATFPCHLHSFSATDQCLTNLQEKRKFQHVPSPASHRHRCGCSSSSGTPGVFEGLELGPRRRTALAATQLLGSGCICGRPTSPKSSLCPELGEICGAIDTFAVVAKHLVQGDTGRIEQPRYQFKVTLWQLTPI